MKTVIDPRFKSSRPERYRSSRVTHLRPPAPNYENGDLIMSMKVEKFEGTPIELGAHIWTRFCLPALKANDNRSHKHLMQLYVGFFMAGFGSLASDVSHEEAVKILEEMVNEFAKMEADLPGSAKH